MSVSMSNDHGGDVAGGNKFSTFVNLLLPACPTTLEGLIASASQVTAHGGGWGVENGEPSDNTTCGVQASGGSPERHSRVLGMDRQLLRPGYQAVGAEMRNWMLERLQPRCFSAHCGCLSVIPHSSIHLGTQADKPLRMLSRR